MRIKRVENGDEVYYINVETGERIEKEDLILNKEPTRSIDETKGVSSIIKIIAVSIFVICSILALFIFLTQGAVFGALILVFIGLFVLILFLSSSGIANLINKMITKASEYTD